MYQVDTWFPTTTAIGKLKGNIFVHLVQVFEPQNHEKINEVIYT